MKPLSLIVNGETVETHVEPRTSLADFLRGHCALTGTHLGCEHGVCGACTIMINGRPARSCITYAVQAEGCNIRTIEDFDTDNLMGALRDEFSRQHALQCGFCTPGMLITAHDIVSRLSNPGEARVREEIAGNLCRCTGYAGIVQAVQNVGDSFAPDRTFRSVVPQATTPARIPVSTPSHAPAASTAEVTAPISGGTTVAQNFVVNVGLDQVWTFFQDLRSVAACIPGTELIDHDDRNFTGRVVVNFGPVRASFTGSGAYEFDGGAKSGVLNGAGRDTLTGSLISGALSFSLAELSTTSTRVDTVMTFKISGLLAQFSRGSIVKEFVNRMMTEFSETVSAKLTGASADASPNRVQSNISAFALLRWWISSAIRTLLSRSLK